MNKTTNQIAKFCLEGLVDLKKSDSFDDETFYPNSEGNIVLRESQGPIDDLTLLPSITAILHVTQNKKVFAWAKLILFRLLRNTKSPEIADYLIEAIKTEQEAWKIKNLTSILGDTGSYVIRMDELTYLLEHPDKSIRSNVIRGLQFSQSPSIEEPLISVLTSSKSDFDILFALWAINGVATKKSLDILKTLLYHKKQDIKIASLSGIAHVLKEDGCTFYLQLLDDKKYRDKDIVTAYLRQYGGREAVPAICDRTKKLVSRKRGRPTMFRDEDRSQKTELMLNVEFLSKFYFDFPSIENLFTHLEKKWDNILEIEKNDLRGVMIASRQRTESCDGR